MDSWRHQRDRSGDLPNAQPHSTEWGAVLDPVWPTHQGILPDADTEAALYDLAAGRCQG